jgi:class 3 adenylate cyclase
LLPVRAKGESQRVVVLLLDVRGFSSFAKIAESSDAAEFLRSAYLKMIGDYFGSAAFYKLTGDGMLVLFRYDRETLAEVVQTTVRTAIQLVEGFSTICDDDPMINFDVPGEMGIGLARGAATALVSGDTVLDYSGRPLNLASRLMDLARPRGLVMDESIGIELLDEGTRALFTRDMVYVKGIADDEPIPVYLVDEWTEIPGFNKVPIGQTRRITQVLAEKIPFRQVCEMARFRHELNNVPVRMDNMVIRIRAPAVKSNGAKHWSRQT